MFLLFYGPSAWNKDWLIDLLNVNKNVKTRFFQRNKNICITTMIYCSYFAIKMVSPKQTV